MLSPASRLAEDVNTVSRFLADQQSEPHRDGFYTDVLVLCTSEVLHGAETIFRRLADGSLRTKLLVLCGGLGHSTERMWKAVKCRPEYSKLVVQGLPEARVLELILQQHQNRDAIHRSCRVVVEDKSTNCGANASETRRLLESLDLGGQDTPRTIMVVQDPTMSRRMRASFEKVYEDLPQSPEIVTFPTLVPRVVAGSEKSLPPGSLGESNSTQLRFDTPELLRTECWEMPRFLGLMMGEIPRLRDDKNGYGPRGTNFIAHVDIPSAVEEAWSRLQNVSGLDR